MVLGVISPISLRSVGLYEQHGKRGLVKKPCMGTEMVNDLSHQCLPLLEIIYALDLADMYGALFLF